MEKEENRVRDNTDFHDLEYNVVSMKFPWNPRNIVIEKYQGIIASIEGDILMIIF